MYAFNVQMINVHCKRGVFETVALERRISPQRFQVDSHFSNNKHFSKTNRNENNANGSIANVVLFPSFSCQPASIG